ncbi:hypothetical protein DICPUDRAFT_77270 [Dictyostelium purpureum]|uniref:Uncharacterized protein n=1 Tax=Dictyostelium purpureum TaxID=5786 RepID=F0ZG45_DICPU|nr:uncharacterized protein DICPUDRAFT_77270 [Dictyostelium purpureum]EGC37096.1 hypothetical protein DICPUDRAFT_77270 [Dictyostelium purpureum]|eukprot:XP_003286377.1 hypothetical protein DICPUDRAFT_77270 [Dictyostelium purpureum]
MIETIKIVCNGDLKVGKTSFIKVFIDDLFPEVYQETILCSIDYKNFEIGNKKFKLQIWEDNFGYRGCFPNEKRLIENTSIAFLIYDITNLQSYQSILRYCNGFFNEKTIVTLVGTKLDIVDLDNSKRKVPKEVVKENSMLFGYDYFEISSKYNINVHNCFLKQISKLSLINDNINININNDKNNTAFNNNI